MGRSVTWEVEAQLNSGEGTAVNTADRDTVVGGLISIGLGILAIVAGALDWLKVYSILLITIGGCLTCLGALVLELFVMARTDAKDQPLARWHFGQLVMATVFMLAMATFGIGGAFIALIALTECTEVYAAGCRIAQWPIGILGGLYGVTAVLLLPISAWWTTWFGYQRALKDAERELLFQLAAGRSARTSEPRRPITDELEEED